MEKSLSWREQILHKAIKTYGETAQIIKCIEEMAELTTPLCKYLAFKSRQEVPDSIIDDIREELADSKIMLEQMNMIFGDTSEPEQYKLERLEGRLEGHERGDNDK